MNDNNDTSSEVPDTSTVSTAPVKKPFRPSLQLSGQLPLVLALLIIAGMLGIWRPWSATTSNDSRTISVSGQATITADPDEFTFNPSYDFTGSKQQALADATAKTTEIVAKLKSLGVPDNKIKTDTSGYSSNYYDPSSSTYYAYLTIIVGKKDLAQKVQDYLLTTDPSGSVTPQAEFSKAKEQQLTSTARDQATKDARVKADQTAKNLGFKVGKVKAFHDEPDNNFIQPIYGKATAVSNDLAVGAASAPIQQGQNDLVYEVSVTYYID
jgi:uncharacterized protein YggE